MKAALHQQLRLAFMDQLYRTRRGGLAMSSVDKLERSDIEVMLASNGLDPLGGTDQDRREQAVLGRLNHPGKRAFVAWVYHGAAHARGLLCTMDQAIIFRLAVRHHALALRSGFDFDSTPEFASTPKS